MKRLIYLPLIACLLLLLGQVQVCANSRIVVTADTTRAAELTSTIETNMSRHSLWNKKRMKTKQLKKKRSSPAFALSIIFSILTLALGNIFGVLIWGSTPAAILALVLALLAFVFGLIALRNRSLRRFKKIAVVFGWVLVGLAFVSWLIPSFQSFVF